MTIGQYSADVKGGSSGSDYTRLRFRLRDCEVQVCASREAAGLFCRERAGHDARMEYSQRTLWVSAGEHRADAALRRLRARFVARAGHLVSQDVDLGEVDAWIADWIAPVALSALGLAAPKISAAVRLGVCPAGPPGDLADVPAQAKGGRAGFLERENGGQDGLLVQADDGQHEPSFPERF